MGEEKKKGSVLPPYTAAEITNAATAKAGGSLPKGLILVKENRELIHTDSVFEGVASYSYEERCASVQAEKNSPQKSEGNIAVKTKEKPKG